MQILGFGGDVARLFLGVPNTFDLNFFAAFFGLGPQRFAEARAIGGNQA